MSPVGGAKSYQAAYSVLRPEHKEKTFVILGTSHYGEPEKFGLTRKAFRTPLGDVANDTRVGGLARSTRASGSGDGGFLPLI